MPVVRYLEWYEPDNEEFVGRIALDLSLPELQGVFGVPRGNPMYDCWAVKAQHVEYLSRETGITIDLSRFAYFVSAEGD